MIGDEKREREERGISAHKNPKMWNTNTKEEKEKMNLHVHNYPRWAVPLLVHKIKRNCYLLAYKDKKLRVLSALNTNSLIKVGYSQLDLHLLLNPPISPLSSFSPQYLWSHQQIKQVCTIIEEPFGCIDFFSTPLSVKQIIKVWSTRIEHVPNWLHSQLHRYFQLLLLSHCLWSNISSCDWCWETLGLVTLDIWLS